MPTSEKSLGCVTGIGDSSFKAGGLSVNLTMRSRTSEYLTSITAVIAFNITKHQTNVDVCNWKIPQNLRLADPEFNRPHRVDRRQSYLRPAIRCPDGLLPRLPGSFAAAVAPMARLLYRRARLFRLMRKPNWIDLMCCFVGFGRWRVTSTQLLVLPGKSLTVKLIS